MNFGGLAHESPSKTNSVPGSAFERARRLSHPGIGFGGNSLRRSLHYDIDIGVADGGLWASGSLSQPVELRCVSCLQKFVHEIQVPAFAVHTELHGPEMIDLTPFMREDLLLNLPAHPHCDRDGDRICNLKKIKAEEPDSKGKSDWSKLDKLKLNR